MSELNTIDPRALVVLAGAGISLDAPSNLLDGESFMRNVLASAAPADLDRSWVMSVLELPTPGLCRPGERLRFEALMHGLVDQGVDPDLSVLDCLDRCDRPNFLHFVLADLIRAGATVMTTNFDRLIEIAWRHLTGTDMAVAAFDDDFPTRLPDIETVPTLWKLHGSLSIAGQDTRASVQATMARVLSRQAGTRKTTFIADALCRRDLLVLGYSGWDDFDLVPILANTASTRRLFWINHAPGLVTPRVEDARAVQRETGRVFELDAVARDRIWFTHDSRGHPIRDSAKTLLVTVDTMSFMRQLAPALPARGGFPIGNGSFPFGRTHPDEVTRYFTAWADSLSSGDIERHEFVAALHDVRTFRDAARQLQSVRTIVRRLRHRRRLPEDRIRLLVEEYNSRQAGEVSERPFDELRREAVDLGSLLPPSLQGIRLRLLACLTWELDGRDAGNQAFEHAVAFDNTAGYRASELGTLITWRVHAGFNWLGDLIPAAASNRIEDLADEIGFLPVVWRQEIQRHAHVIDEHADLVPIYRRISRIRRHAIDIGDVRGEALCSVQIGRLYLLDQQAGLATEEFLRVIELNRLLSDPQLSKEADFFLAGCRQQTDPAYVDRMLPEIRRSIWSACRNQ